MKRAKRSAKEEMIGEKKERSVSIESPRSRKPKYTANSLSITSPSCKAANQHEKLTDNIRERSHKEEVRIERCHEAEEETERFMARILNKLGPHVHLAQPRLAQTTLPIQRRDFRIVK